MLKIKIFHPPCDLSDAFWIRDEVFTKEQGFSIPDVDEYDERSVHVVIYRDERPVATGRVYSDDDKITFHLGRIAVLKQYRGMDLGLNIMEELEKIARVRGAKHLVVGAQLYAIPFYQKCGYVPTGKRFFEEFCEHETMIKEV